MKHKIHFLSTEDNSKVSEWYTAEHLIPNHLDIVYLRGGFYEVVGRRTTLIGEPFGAYDRVISVFPL